MIYHASSCHTNEIQIVFSCHLCDKLLSSKSSLQRHMNSSNTAKIRYLHYVRSKLVRNSSPRKGVSRCTREQSAPRNAITRKICADCRHMANKQGDVYSVAICTKRISRGKEIFDCILNQCIHAKHASIARR